MPFSTYLSQQVHQNSFPTAEADQNSFFYVHTYAVQKLIFKKSVKKKTFPSNNFKDENSV